MLAGGVNLQREPRAGRNFEYAGEDPLLAGVITGEQIRGIQSNHLVATVKHFAYNDQETGRFKVDARIDDAAGRMSDLLAFQIAIERGDPGSVMCSYNRVNGAYACENDYLLNQVLKRDWGYKGYVMSDWARCIPPYQPRWLAWTSSRAGRSTSRRTSTAHSGRRWKTATCRRRVSTTWPTASCAP